MGLKAKLGWPILIAISMSPLIFWYLAESPFSLRYINPYTFFISLGEISGLVGLSMYSLDLLLSGRFSFVEDFFGGMSRIYKAHHILGGIAFILLMIHPLFIAVSYATSSLHEAAALLLPGTDWTIDLGIASLALTMTLLILTFYVDLPYEFWKFTHKFLGAVFILGAIHSFFVPSDISRNPALFNYMLFIVSLGVIPYLYRTVFYKFFINRLDYRIDEIDYLNPKIIEIFMTPEKENLSYMPGQFIFIGFEQKGLSNEVHPFSLTSSPTDNYLTIAVKNEGDYTKRLMELSIKSRVKVEGGFGRFSYILYPIKKQIWIGGGIGITPFISMAKSLINYSGYQIDLYYSAKNRAETIYLKLLTKISESGDGLRFIPYYSQTQGRLSAKNVFDISRDVPEREIFICGPPPMMKSLSEQFVKLGVKRGRIHTEEFTMS
jgi:predicted ferric reductase